MLPKNANVPLFPRLSLQVPLPFAGLTMAETCTGLPEGAVTVVKLNV